MSDFILTNLPCSGRILIVADAVTEQAVCTSGSVVEYRLAKARVAGSNPVSCFLIITRVKHLSFALFSNHYIILSKRDTESTLNWNGGLKWL